MSVTFRRTGVWQLYFSFSQAPIAEVHCKNKLNKLNCSFTHEKSTCILVCIYLTAYFMDVFVCVILQISCQSGVD